VPTPNLPPGFDFTDPDVHVKGLSVEELMFYRSANFDDEVFENPFSFHILRSPHVGFGGTGAHYCVGANLARMTISLMFDAIADHLPNLAPLAEAERLRSGWLNGVKRWQVDYIGKGLVASTTM